MWAKMGAHLSVKRHTQKASRFLRPGEAQGAAGADAHAFSCTRAEVAARLQPTLGEQRQAQGGEPRLRREDFPPMRLLRGYAKPTMEFLELGPDGEVDFDGGEPMPGDGRLPAARIMPREWWDMKEFRTDLAHSKLVNDLGVVNEALQELLAEKAERVHAGA